MDLETELFAAPEIEASLGSMTLHINDYTITLTQIDETSYKLSTTRMGVTQELEWYGMTEEEISDILQNEIERVQNETQRISNELSRVAAESLRTSQFANIDISAQRVSGGTAVYITDKTGTTRTYHILDGEQGPKGDKGDKGDTGEQGPKGDKGDTGDQGIQGPKGDKGDQGDAGETGAQGPKGDKGDKGDTGDQGIQGPKGDTGEQGIQGPKGDTGSNGLPGTVISSEKPSYEAFWVNPNASETVSIPQIADNAISTTDTWSSSKINAIISDGNWEVVTEFTVDDEPWEIHRINFLKHYTEVRVLMQNRDNVYSMSSPYIYHWTDAGVTIVYYEGGKKGCMSYKAICGGLCFGTSESCNDDISNPIHRAAMGYYGAKYFTYLRMDSAINAGTHVIVLARNVHKEETT